MTVKVLALNAGSNSLKFELFGIEISQSASNRLPQYVETLLSGSYDNIGKEHGTFSLFDGSKPTHKEDQDSRDYGHAAELLVNWLNGAVGRSSEIVNLNEVDRIGHRVVHGGDVFKAPALITSDVVRKIRELKDLAPLHNASALEVIRAIQAAAPKGMPMFAVFDTVFHQTIPEEAALYALPIELAKRHKIKRYGFHGISHRYLMLRYLQLSGREQEESNLITVHLEGGSSITAIREGRSVETSMGFTPLEGLVMGTRTGDLDPAIVPYLMRKENLDAKEVEDFLNKQCGLLGLSGVSSDTRELVPRAEEPAVALALSVFCHRVRKYIGAYLAVLNGADAIVLGGGISENAPAVRERIFRDLDWFGIYLDEERNRRVVDREGIITNDKSRVPVWVIPTKENLMVAHETAHHQLN